jgi:DNA-binding NtrC family response regulator
MNAQTSEALVERISARAPRGVTSVQVDGRPSREGNFPLLVGESPAMRALHAELRRVLQSDVAVCLRGESGTGKELVARTIHAEGRRSRGPLVAINCAAIPESLQESALFGHERGAFTGATQAQRGCFEQAEGGTLFLDELGDMSPATQVKLLRALQERMIRRVGGTADLRTNVRIICATHRDLEQEVANGRFREDLYFRLMVFPIEIPPLRDRLLDVPALVDHFLALLREDVGRGVIGVAPDATAALMQHRWAGNIRELQNVVHRAMLSCEGDVITLADLPQGIQRAAWERQPRAEDPSVPPIVGLPKRAEHDRGAAVVLPFLDLRKLERLAIFQALEVTGMQIGRAAALLGMGRSTLYRRVVELGLMPEGGESAAARAAACR